MTAQELIDQSLQVLNVTAAGEGPSPSERSTGFNHLNRLLGSFSSRGTPALGISVETFAATGASSITFGPGGSVSAIRPMKIRSVSSSFQGVSIGQLKKLTPEEWADIPQKDATATVAERFFYDARYPIAQMYFHPKPISGGQITVLSEKPITSFSAITDTVDFPPGYERALVYALAVDMWPMYPQTRTLEALQALANDAIGAIATLNAEVLADPAPPVQALRAATDQGMTQ